MVKLLTCKKLPGGVMFKAGSTTIITNAATATLHNSNLVA
jgi:hypothetical protein